MANEMDAEVFAVGKWNGMEFGADALAEMVRAFDSLKERLQVPLKFGHNEEQPITDGLPALGWIDKLWVAGDKLMARFSEVPDIVRDAFKKKLYRNVSIELSMDVEHKGAQYPYVMTGVALLGADLPAVNTLADLTHYMTRQAAFSLGKRMAFAAIAGDLQEGDDNMSKELEALTDEVKGLTAQVATFSAANTKLVEEKAAQAAEIATLKAEVAKFNADKKAAEDVAKKAAVSKKRDEIKAFFEAGVKANAITPAQREKFSVLLRLDDDAAVEQIDVAQIKELAGLPAAFSLEQQGKQRSGSDDSGESVDTRVAKGIADILAKKEAPDYFSAQRLLFTRDAKLAREYVEMTHE